MTNALLRLKQFKVRTTLTLELVGRNGPGSDLVGSAVRTADEQINETTPKLVRRLLERITPSSVW